MRKSVKYVEVDLGYGLAELWTTAKVVGSQKAKNLFDNDEHEMLLVETAGGERIWVDYWRDVA